MSAASENVFFNIQFEPKTGKDCVFSKILVFIVSFQCFFSASHIVYKNLSLGIGPLYLNASFCFVLF